MCADSPLSQGPGMTRREYLYRRAREFDWAPGWDAIDAEFARLYPNERPERVASRVVDRARFGGGEEYLDSAALFRSPKGYAHIVTYGMSALEPDIGSFGGEYSGWGYEMTVKVAEPYTDDCWWAIGTFASLAKYTNTTGRMMVPGYSLAGGGDPICPGAPEELTGLLFIPDTEARTIQTIHGEVAFNQMTAITTSDILALALDPNRYGELHERLLEDNPDGVIDLSRARSYL